MADALRCLVVDDEAPAHLVLENYIGQMDRFVIVGNCFHPLEAINFMHKHAVDLLFLDITMPGMSGLELLSTLTSKPMVVLTTAYSEYALESYNYDVIDYLLKPVEFKRFLKAADKALLNFQKRNITGALATPTREPDSIMIKVNNSHVNVMLDQILFCQSWGNYVKIFTDEKIFLSTSTTAELEERLPRNMFMRSHKSYLLSIKKVDGIQGNEITIAGKKLPVGLTYKRELVQRLLQESPHLFK